MKKGSGFLEGRQGNRAGLGAERTDSGPEVLIFSWLCFVSYFPKILTLKTLNIVPLYPALRKKGVFVGEDQGLGGPHGWQKPG